MLLCMKGKRTGEAPNGKCKFKTMGPRESKFVRTGIGIGSRACSTNSNGLSVARFGV